MSRFTTRKIAGNFHLLLSPTTATMRRCPSRSATIDASFDVKASGDTPVLLRATYSLRGWDSWVRVQVIGDCTSDAKAGAHDPSSEATSPPFEAKPGEWTRVCHRLVICARSNTPVEGFKWIDATLGRLEFEPSGTKEALVITNQIDI